MRNVIFADTNLFLRYLMNDDSEQADAVEHVLKQAKDGAFQLIANPLIIAEIVWVLEKVYDLDRLAIRKSILAIVNTPGIEIDAANLVSSAVDIYASENIDFVDAFSVSWMKDQKIDAVYTFDKRHFSRVDSITVLIPGLND